MKIGVKIRILIGPFAGLVGYILAHSLGMKQNMANVIGLAVWMLTWWLDGIIRMGITGLLPIVFLPVLSVNSGNQISQVYFSDGMVLCIGSLLMAHAIELCNLHIAAAEFITKYSSNKGPSMVLLLFIFVSGGLSMWISNTATAALMLPVANAFIASFTEKQEQQKQHLHSSSSTTNQELLLSPQQLGIAVDIAIAFSVSVGGTATLIGTGSNIVLQGVMKSTFGEENHEVTFLGWFAISCPLSIMNLFLLWVILCVLFVWNGGLWKLSSKKASHEYQLQQKSANNNQDEEDVDDEEEQEEQEEEIVQANSSSSRGYNLHQVTNSPFHRYQKEYHQAPNDQDEESKHDLEKQTNYHEVKEQNVHSNPPPLQLHHPSDPNLFELSDLHNHTTTSQQPEQDTAEMKYKARVVVISIIFLLFL
jgi:hypothetical protein